MALVRYDLAFGTHVEMFLILYVLKEILPYGMQLTLLIIVKVCLRQRL